jgi:hypothetical protein
METFQVWWESYGKRIYQDSDRVFLNGRSPSSKVRAKSWVEAISTEFITLSDDAKDNWTFCVADKDGKLLYRGEYPYKTVEIQKKSFNLGNLEISMWWSLNRYNGYIGWTAKEGLGPIYENKTEDDGSYHVRVGLLGFFFTGRSRPSKLD